MQLGYIAIIAVGFAVLLLLFIFKVFKTWQNNMPDRIPWLPRSRKKPKYKDD